MIFPGNALQNQIEALSGDAQFNLLIRLLSPFPGAECRVLLTKFYTGPAGPSKKEGDSKRGRRTSLVMEQQVEAHYITVMDVNNATRT